METLIVKLQNRGAARESRVFYPEHPPQATAYFKELAERHDLLVTGGTNFHGSLKPEIQLGVGTGEFRVPFALYERLCDHWLDCPPAPEIRIADLIRQAGII
ncbi:MAG: hypothetical protein U5R30_18255 [Deltaproteobacteria bacterium]|nr:hypothetical protein [Deltaproteobacteria bacterium]